MEVNLSCWRGFMENRMFGEDCPVTGLLKVHSQRFWTFYFNVKDLIDVEVTSLRGTWRPSDQGACHMGANALSTMFQVWFLTGHTFAASHSPALFPPISCFSPPSLSNKGIKCRRNNHKKNKQTKTKQLLALRFEMILVERKKNLSVETETESRAALLKGMQAGQWIYVYVRGGQLFLNWQDEATAH